MGEDSKCLSSILRLLDQMPRNWRNEGPPFFLSSLTSSAGLSEVIFPCSQPELIIRCFSLGRRDKSLLNMLTAGLLTFQQSVFRHRQPKDQRKNVTLKWAEQGGQRDSSVAKSTCYCREKRFGSQHLRWGHTAIYITPAPRNLTISLGLCGHRVHMHILSQRNTHAHII